MKEFLVVKNTLPEAYHESLQLLNEWGEITPCSDYNTEQRECSMTIQVLNPLSEPRISKLFIGGPEELEQYRQEMLYGILDFEIQKGNWQYTYHDRIDNYEITPGLGVSQIKFVIDELKRNTSTRRAVVDIRLNKDDMYSDDPACLQHIQYFIRDNKLECKVLFRSNDACKATFMNAFALICLQEMIAKELGVEVGTYTHRANSYHCYARDFELLKGYCNRIAEGTNLTYDYKDDWEELMEDAKSEIAIKVEELKNGRE